MVVIPSPPSASALQVKRTDSIEALIIDRQPLFLAALGRLLAAPPVAYHVVTASRSDVGLEMARSGSVSLVCCDLYAEPISGLEVVRIMTEERPEVPIILLGDVGDEVRLAAAIGSNVAGLFTKGSDPDEFLAGLRAVVSGHRAIGSGVISQLLARFLEPNVQEPKRFGNQLSPTELEILAMIAQAQSIRVIAASRGISHKTVRNHLAKIYRKLELHGRTEAMLWAARQGLIPGEVH